MRFSPTNSSFYPEDINYPSLPDDLVTVTDQEFNDAINARANGASLSYVNNNIVITEQIATLSDLKIEKILEINNAFITATKSGFTTTSGLTMNADLPDIQRLKSAYDLALLLNLNELPILVDYNNVVHADIIMADVLAMVIELGVHYQTLYTQKQNLRGQALAATNEAELNSILLEI